MKSRSGTGFGSALLAVVLVVPASAVLSIAGSLPGVHVFSSVTEPLKNQLNMGLTGVIIGLFAGIFFSVLIKIQFPRIFLKTFSIFMILNFLVICLIIVNRNNWWR